MSKAYEIQVCAELMEDVSVVPSIAGVSWMTGGPPEASPPPPQETRAEANTDEISEPTKRVIAGPRDGSARSYCVKV
jgi:hypothetical protein